MAEKETIDIKTIEQWQKILDESSRYQIEDNETFLDLCHYTGERFEEICSRVLAFFLNPNGKHGFSILWFNALCQTINDKYEKQNNNKKIESEYFYYKFSMEITTEESTSYADITNKRIDIVLKTPTLVIGIENKINAQLYNDLDQYKKHIQGKYDDKNINRIFVVLTARDLTNNESKKAKDNGFIVIKYGDLFNNVTSLLGKYVAKCNQKYLSFMLDFIQTVKNRANIMEETEMDKFFAKNKQAIDALNTKYNAWIENNNKKQVDKISELLEEINEKTNATWWDYKGWDLGVQFKTESPNKYLIGIESHFEYDNDNNNNPLGIFRIYITTWKMACWEPYKNIEKLQNYPDITHKDIGELNGYNRVYLHMRPIKLKDFNDNFDAYKEEIIKKLKEYYDFLKEITDNIDK